MKIVLIVICISLAVYGLIALCEKLYVWGTAEKTVAEAKIKELKQHAQAYLDILKASGYADLKSAETKIADFIAHVENSIKK